jgi:hypothetical protein
MRWTQNMTAKTALNNFKPVNENTQIMITEIENTRIEDLVKELSLKDPKAYIGFKLSKPDAVADIGKAIEELDEFVATMKDAPADLINLVTSFTDSFQQLDSDIDENHLFKLESISNMNESHHNVTIVVNLIA